MYILLSIGQVLTAAKEVCRQAFQLQPQRLVTPMYSCNIVVNAEMLGMSTVYVISLLTEL